MKVSNESDSERNKNWQEYTRGENWKQHSERSIAVIGTLGPALHSVTNNNNNNNTT
jgi:hypothetical protein